MATRNGNFSYRENQVTTASRGQLLLMAYDGILRFLTEGRHAMLEQHFEEKNRCLGKAQSLLMELLLSLDRTAYPALTDNLDALYRFMYDQLTMANVHDDEQTVTKIIAMIRDLREAWGEADRLVRCREASAVPVGAGGYRG